jgi:hypothetical protein
MTWVNPLNRMTVIAATAATLMVAMAVLAVAPARVAAAADDEKDWKILGEAKIEKKGGTAAIDVGGEEGLVKRIKFEVRGTDVEFKKVTVTYENGDPEQIEIRDKVRRGGKTRTIDLKGGNRVIKKVVIAFKLEKEADRDARIVLMGHK